MAEDVLVVGSGGREHALSWKISQSRLAGTVYTAPGNGGTTHNVPLQPDDLQGLADFARDRGCFTVVGPEAPLAAGIVDVFGERNLDIFGPTRDAARLESSKVWAKDFMRRHGIRTAGFEVFDDPDEAAEYAGSSADRGVVVKADGLAAGKGVVVCDGPDQARSAVSSMMVDGRFGGAGRRVVVEERLEGVEASYIAICDGGTAVPMATSQDHKRIYEGDRGPNTGGMGAYSPTPAITGEMAETIRTEVIDRTIRGMALEGMPFRGFLYAGIMIQDGEPFVLEYNVRMGDPECQPMVVRMDFDLYEYIRAASAGTLDGLPPPRWSRRPAVCVVLASRGYPGGYRRGRPIAIPGRLPPDTQVFHAGTAIRDGSLVSDGGRVLGVTAAGDDLAAAVSRAYEAAGMVEWDDKYCRPDIGSRAL